MHMRCCIAFTQMMIIIRVYLHLKLLIGLHQRVDILPCMLGMNIIIRRTMNDQHIARQILGARQ